MRLSKAFKKATIGLSLMVISFFSSSCHLSFFYKEKTNIIHAYSVFGVDLPDSITIDYSERDFGLLSRNFMYCAISFKDEIPQDILEMSQSEDDGFKETWDEKITWYESDGKHEVSKDMLPNFEGDYLYLRRYKCTISVSNEAGASESEFTSIYEEVPEDMNDQSYVAGYLLCLLSPNDLKMYTTLSDFYTSVW